MKINDVEDHSGPDNRIGQVKKPWVTPSLEVIGLESAENGKKHVTPDGRYGNSSASYS